MELKSWGQKLCICDRVRGNQPYVSRNIFPVFAGYRKYNALSRAVQNLSDYHAYQPRGCDLPRCAF